MGVLTTTSRTARRPAATWRLLLAWFDRPGRRPGAPAAAATVLVTAACSAAAGSAPDASWADQLTPARLAVTAVGLLLAAACLAAPRSLRGLRARSAPRPQAACDARSLSAPGPGRAGWLWLGPAGWAVVLLSAEIGGLAGLGAGPVPGDLVGPAAGGSATGYYAAGYAALFGYLGLAGRRSIVLAAATLAGAGLAGAALLGGPLPAGTQLAGAAALAAAVGLLVAGRVRAERTAHRQAALLQAALGRLVGAESEQQAVGIAAQAARQLLAADGVLVLLAELPGSTVLAVRGCAGRVGVAAARVDTSTDRSELAAAARTGQPVFVPDAATAPPARQLVVEHEVGSIAYVPIPADGGLLGVVVIWWAQPRPALDPFDRQVVDLLTGPVGRVLQGHRRVPALAPARTAAAEAGGRAGNRRQFDAALTELPVGGSVLLFDLDPRTPPPGQPADPGHPAGDDLLRAFVRALVGSVRDSDVVARSGDSELGVLLPPSSRLATGAVLERLHQRWKAQHCGFSVGLAVRRAGEAPIGTFNRARADLLTTKRLRSG